MRLPAPLALLPDGWQGQAETRLPPFASEAGGAPLIDPAALDLSDTALLTALKRTLTLEIDGTSVTPEVQALRVHPDTTRPRFGTVKTARAALAVPAGNTPVTYFDATLDILLTAPAAHGRDIRLASDLGAGFEVMDRFGTVIKLHRTGGTETRAALGTFDVQFPASTSRAETLTNAALSGAEHIYRGPEHLALILLIALAARGWRQALGWASAFTVGHIVTLAAGLYGVAPSAGWFIRLVELGIALSIVGAGIAIVIRRHNAFGWGALLIVGLVHGYGFAASAATAMFAGSFDPWMLMAFAMGLEFCQFALYALLLPVVLVVDRALPANTARWRRALSLGIAVVAVSETWARVGHATEAFGIA